MSCYHPLKGFDISAIEGLTKNNKKNYKICSYEVNHLEKINGKYIPFADSFRSSRCERYVSDFIEIPCGKCIGCRLDYTRDWANRMMLEASYHEQNYFITLTYDDTHVPKSYYACPETGEALPSLTLSKRDIQLFLKRLRKLTGQSFRYYLCGEYGSNTHRPHYHLIVFGLNLDDLKPLKQMDGWKYYTSATIERASAPDGSGYPPVSFALSRYHRAEPTLRSSELSDRPDRPSLPNRLHYREARLRAPPRGYATLSAPDG